VFGDEELDEALALRSYVAGCATGAPCPTSVSVSVAVAVSVSSIPHPALVATPVDQVQRNVLLAN